MARPGREAASGEEHRPFARRIAGWLGYAAIGLTLYSAAYGAMQDGPEVDEFAAHVPVFGGIAEASHDAAQEVWQTAEGQAIKDKLDSFMEKFNQNAPNFGEWNITGQE